MGLGIGITTGVYSAVRAIARPPAGVGAIDRVVNLYHARGGSPAFSGFSLPDFRDLRARQSTLDLMTAWTFTTMAYAVNGETGSSFGEIVGGEYFACLGVRPLRGRLLQPADDHPGAAPVVVISYQLWQRAFGGAEDVVGRTMKVNGQPFEVVGVAAPEFRGLVNNGLTPSALWAPISSAAAIYRRSPGVAFDPENRESRFLFAKGVLRAGKSVEDVRTELAVLAAQLEATDPIGAARDPRTSSPYERTRAWHARMMTDVRISDSAGTTEFIDGLLTVVMFAVGAVLLVACSNVANLALARGSSRRHETGVRLALGASRWRLVRESVVESLLLSLAGGLLGIGVAHTINVALSAELPIAGTVSSLQIAPQLDLTVCLVAALATALALGVSGLGPAIQSTRGDVRTALTADGAASAAPRWRGRRYLIAAQVAVSVSLLALAALGVTQLRSLEQQDHGFSLRELAVAEVDFESQGYNANDIERIVSRFLSQVAERPDAMSASVASGLPSGLSSYRRGQIVGDEKPPLFGEILAGGPQLIQTLGVPLLYGRTWDVTDPSGSDVVLIDEWTARKLFGATNVVGRDVDVLEGERARRATVIGVLGDVYRTGTLARQSALIYVPFRQDYGTRLLFAARTGGDPAALAEVLRQTLRRSDPDLVVRHAGAGPDLIGSTAQFFRISSAVATLLGTFAWLLALAGLYGVLSHLVLRRAREIGIRVALGASREDITRMVVREGLSPVVLGVVAGLLVGAGARAALQTQMLRQPPAMDIVVLVVAPAALLGAAIVACYLPARRAASVDPNVTLRQL